MILKALATKPKKWFYHLSDEESGCLNFFDPNSQKRNRLRCREEATAILACREKLAVSSTL